MRYATFTIFSLLGFATSVFAQFSPTPVINNEIRDGTSIRRRALDLETFKKEAGKLRRPESPSEQKIQFAEIKDNFESIQKLQSSIVKTYTTGQKINYSKIGDLAAELSKRAIRLDEVLFESKIDPHKQEKRKKQVTVRDLIIQLDNLIGSFVESPLFKEASLIDQKTAEKSQIQLERIITLSELLSSEAKKLV